MLNSQKSPKCLFVSIKFDIFTCKEYFDASSPSYIRWSRICARVADKNTEEPSCRHHHSRRAACAKLLVAANTPTASSPATGSKANSGQSAQIDSIKKGLGIFAKTITKAAAAATTLAASALQATSAHIAEDQETKQPWAVVKSESHEIQIEGSYGPDAMNPYSDEASAAGYVWNKEMNEGAAANEFEALMWKDLGKNSNQGSVLIWDAVVTQDSKSITTIKILAVAPAPDFHYVSIFVKK